MARVLALVPDLLFGSRVQSALSTAGHEVELIGDEGRLRQRLSDPGPPPAVLVVDLTNDELGGAALVRALSEQGQLAGVRTMGFYSHVDVPARDQFARPGW